MVMSFLSATEYSKVAADTKTVLMDVRMPPEFEQVHAQNAVLEPLDKLDADVAAKKHGLGKQDPIYLICKSGARAKTAGQKFVLAGYENVILVEGGTEAWIAANLPVVRGQSKVLPLDRQIQIIVGTLVVTGVLLSHFVHPAWILLSAFVGCGLIFAGISGICALAIVVAKMPWNQASYAGRKVTSCSIDPESGKKSCCQKE